MGEIIDKLKGKAKQVEGDLTGDRSRHAEGTVDEKKGEAKEKLEDLERDARDTERDTKE